MSWRTNRRTRKPYKTVMGRSISDLEINPQYSETVATGLVSDLDNEEMERIWSFTDRDIDIEEFMRMLNISPDEDFGAAFVRRSALEHGDIGPDDILFITGTIPERHKQIYQVSDLRRR